MNLSSHEVENLIRDVGDRAMANALANLAQKPGPEQEQEPTKPRLPLRKKSLAEAYKDAGSALTLLTPEERSTTDSGEPV